MNLDTVNWISSLAPLWAIIYIVVALLVTRLFYRHNSFWEDDMEKALSAFCGLIWPLWILVIVILIPVLLLGRVFFWLATFGLKKNG